MKFQVIVQPLFQISWKLKKISQWQGEYFDVIFPLQFNNPFI